MIIIIRFSKVHFFLSVWSVNLRAGFYISCQNENLVQKLFFKIFGRDKEIWLSNGKMND